MKDDRLRVPVEANYVHAIGLATFAFTRLEWDAVWCCERIAPGVIHSLADRTAGSVAKKLVELAEGRSANVTDDLLDASKKFEELVRLRNGLVHAKPGTDHDQGQRLFRDGEAWTIDAINDAADAFTECSLRLNAILYSSLKQA
jgi:hypothetical protein